MENKQGSWAYAWMNVISGIRREFEDGVDLSLEGIERVFSEQLRRLPL